MEALLQQLEDARNAGKLSDDVISKFNKTGGLKISSSVDNINLDELNKTGQEYESNIKKSQNQISDIIYDEADKKTAIEKAASKIKTKRSDDTRAELLKTTGEFKDKQKDRYQEVKDITDKQKNIANRQANIATAKAGKYGDIYSDGGMANIKNDVIARYGENILNAEQYALNTNRTIDNDLLNVGLKELADKDKRDAFKDALLDKENSYMLNAISEASDGNQQAIKDVKDFYSTYIKAKANNESTRAGFTEQRAFMQKEYEGASNDIKAAILKDNSSKIPGFALIADSIPKLINTYPNLSYSEIQGKIMKMAELALTANQRLDVIASKKESDRTDEEKALYDRALGRGYTVQEQSDRHTSATIAQQQANAEGKSLTGDTIYDNTNRGKEILKQEEEKKINNNQKIDEEKRRSSNNYVSKENPEPINSVVKKKKRSTRTLTKKQLLTIKNKLAGYRSSDRVKYKTYAKKVKELINKINDGSIKLIN